MVGVSDPGRWHRQGRVRGRPDLDLDRGSEGRAGGSGDRVRDSVGEEIRRSGGVAGWAWWVGPVGGCGLLGRSPVGGFAFSFFLALFFVFCFLFFIYFLLISVL